LPLRLPTSRGPLSSRTLSGPTPPNTSYSETTTPQNPHNPRQRTASFRGPDQFFHTTTGVGDTDVKERGRWRRVQGRVRGGGHWDHYPSHLQSSCILNIGSCPRLFCPLLLYRTLFISPCHSSCSRSIRVLFCASRSLAIPSSRFCNDDLDLVLLTRFALSIRLHCLTKYPRGRTLACLGGIRQSG
jgi:hypothetical protein